jgi:hypothetical protein
MIKETKLIEQVLNEILSNKNLINEASTLMAPVPIPKGFSGNFGQKRSYETHPGVDIGVVVGTQVSAIADGTVEIANMNYNPQCGATIDIKYDEGGYWSRFCHMSKIYVHSGQKVKQGEVVGLSGGKVGAVGSGNSQGPHLHVTLKQNGNKVNPVDHINGTNSPIAPMSNMGIDSDIDITDPSLPDENDIDKIYFKPKSINPDEEYYSFSIVKENYNLISEQKIYGSFGYGISSNGYTVTIPKDKNPKIKSAVNGTIGRKSFSSGCKNQTDITHKVNGENFYLQYCGIKNPRQSGNVSMGNEIGQAGEDNITVSLYNSSGERIPIDYYKNREEKTSNAKAPLNKKTVEIDKVYFPVKKVDVDAVYYSPRQINPDEKVFGPKKKKETYREDYRIQKNITKIRKLLK